LFGSGRGRRPLSHHRRRVTIREGEREISTRARRRRLGAVRLFRRRHHRRRERPHPRDLGRRRRRRRGVGTTWTRRNELRDKTAGTGVEIDRQGDELLLTMPAGITFPINSYEVQPQFRSTLDQVASTLASYPSTLIDVYGHTDPSGGDAINIPLSQNRASAVASYLGARGVQRERIATQGFGSSQPLSGNYNRTEAERAANRRVEIRIVPVQQQG
jgi:outer membrane protein OmpA-like peptidoglycan-associated protein